MKMMSIQIYREMRLCALPMMVRMLRKEVVEKMAKMLQWWHTQVLVGRYWRALSLRLDRCCCPACHHRRTLRCFATWLRPSTAILQCSAMHSGPTGTFTVACERQWPLRESPSELCPMQIPSATSWTQPSQWLRLLWRELGRLLPLLVPLSTKGNVALRRFLRLLLSYAFFPPLSLPMVIALDQAHPPQTTCFRPFSLIEQSTLSWLDAPDCVETILVLFQR
mmetsp:Transcript_31509/g.69837  ORF Transcript_31509/g.69837 Transcript_31509/m.69837 type:complete len:222 (-) Transcript_31509:1675-2340(-)